MAELSTEALASASNRVQSGLQAVARDDSTVCRMRSEEVKVSLSDAVRLLYAAGLKVVLADRVCVDKATYEAMSTIAAKAMASPSISRQLTWDDVE